MYTCECCYVCIYVDPSILCFRLFHNADDASREQLEQWPRGRAPKQSDKQVTMLGHV